MTKAQKALKEIIERIDKNENRPFVLKKIAKKGLR